MNHDCFKKICYLMIIMGIIVTFNTLVWADPYADRVVKFYDGGDGFKGGCDVNGNGLADPGDLINIPVSPTVACSFPDNWLVSILPNEYIVFEFTDNTIIDGPGNDLFVKEIGDSGETARVFVSVDGHSFILLGVAYSGLTSYFDLASIPGLCAPVRFVKIYDSLGGAAPGFDLDALGSTPGSTGGVGTGNCTVEGVPLMKQCSSSWGSDVYGHYIGYPDTICEWGCCLSSCAMIINHHGGNTNPRILNNWLRGQNDGYIGMGLVNHNAVVRYARSNGINLYYHVGKPGRNDKVVDAYLCCDEPVILEIGGHFVVATGKSGNGYRINDPGYNRNTTHSYNGIRKYSSTRKDLATLMITVQSPVELLVTDPLGRKTGVDPSTGEEFNEIPHAVYYSEYITGLEDSNHLSPKVKIFELPYPFEGTYEVQIIGTNIGSYKVDFYGYDEEGEPSKKTFIGITAPGAVSMYMVNYSFIPGTPIEVLPSPNIPPKADSGPDQTVGQETHEGTEVTLDGSGSTDPDSIPGTNDDIVSFEWYEGNTLLGSGEIITYTFPIGVHKVTLVVTDSYGETDSDEVIIVVSVDFDNDGIPDDEDNCPESILDENIVIDGCDTGVANHVFEDGCTVSDLIADCAEGAKNHGEFVSCVSHLTNDWKKEGLITGSEKGAIQSCAAQSDVP